MVARQGFHLLLWPLTIEITGVAGAQSIPPAVPLPAASEQRVSADLISRADALKLVDAAIAACERQHETVAPVFRPPPSARGS